MGEHWSLFNHLEVSDKETHCPLIFILCLEFLGQLIEEKCSEKLWYLGKASKSSSSFSHLFFADNLVLFAKANQGNCTAIHEVLDSFCKKSSQGYTSRLMLIWRAGRIWCSVLEFKSTSSIRKYLGIPIKHQGQ